MSVKLSTPITNVDTSLKLALGTKTDSVPAKEFIYLQGSDSISANDVCVYNSAYLATRAVAGSRGPVAVAQGAVVGSRYGWFQIQGLASVDTNGAVASSKPLFLTAGSGKVDDTAVAGDLIMGMFSDTTGTAGAGVMPALLSYPWAGSLSVA